MKIELGSKFIKHLRVRSRGSEILVGILNDSAHYEAIDKDKGLSSFAGGAVRRKSRTPSGTMNEISKSFSSILGLNYLTEPFRNKKNKDILRLAEVFIPLMIAVKSKTNSTKRAENLAQAIVRNPLLRGDYGQNSKKWAKTKGFNRLGFDTGQLFKAIRASVTIKGF